MQILAGLTYTGDLTCACKGLVNFHFHHDGTALALVYS